VNNNKALCHWYMKRGEEEVFVSQCSYLAWLCFAGASISQCNHLIAID